MTDQQLALQAISEAQLILEEYLQPCPKDNTLILEKLVEVLERPSLIVAVSRLQQQAMANVYSALSMSSVATVLTAGNVQAQSIPPEGPVSVIFTATPIPAPKPMPIGIGREFALVTKHAPSLRPSADCGDQFDLSASCRVLHCRSGRT